MSHQQDHVASTQVSNLEEGNNGKDSGTTTVTINPVSDKPQRCLKSAAVIWILQSIQNSNLVARYNGKDSGTTTATINPISDKFHERQYTICFWMCVIALWLDPLFCYSLVINDHKKCLTVDKKLGTIAIVLRSVIDILYVIHVISEFRTGFSLPQANGRVVVHKAAWAITKRFLVDILSVLPLPQVVLLIIIPQVIHTRFLDAVMSFNMFAVLFQYVPRIIRIYPFYKTFARTSGILIGSVALNLSLRARLSFGAFWYLFAVERKTVCWREACNRIGCVRLSCDDILEDYTFLTASCPIKTPNATIFDFGIFHEALDSGIVDSTDFLQKFSYSFWFGLQSLSSLGQNLKPSTYFWEIFFAVIISIFGLILLVFLIGNMQTYLQFKIVSLEKMKSKGQKLDQWMAFHSLPRKLKKRIKEYHHYKWRETKGFDVENLVPNLPKDIRSETVRHLCSDMLKKVPLFKNMDEKLLDAICDKLKMVYYSKQSCLVGEGDPPDEMLFITQGTLRTRTRNGEKSFLIKGSFYGEELLDWALYHYPSLENIPSSTKTVQAQTKVEAFALTANDLKNIVSKYMSHFNLEQLQDRAASTVQEAWRGYSKKKKPYAPSTITIQPAEHVIIAEQQ